MSPLERVFNSQGIALPAAQYLRVEATAHGGQGVVRLGPGDSLSVWSLDYRALLAVADAFQEAARLLRAAQIDERISAAVA